MNTKLQKTPPTIEESFERLTQEEKQTELAHQVSVERLFHLIHNNERTAVSKIICDRFFRRYIRPFERVNPDYNSGFSQMATCCLMIEALESFRNGWDDTRRILKPDGSFKSGGQIFEDFFNHYDEFIDFRGCGKEFYKNIRCGILHQAEATNGWIIIREGDLFEKTTRSINSTDFRKRMNEALKKYCGELEKDDIAWNFLKIKMAYIIWNCHKDVMIV